MGLNRRGWPTASPEVDANLGASSNALEEAEESLSWEVYWHLTLEYFRRWVDALEELAVEMPPIPELCFCIGLRDQ